MKHDHEFGHTMNAKNNHPILSICCEQVVKQEVTCHLTECAVSVRNFRSGLTLSDRFLNSVSQDDGSSLQVHAVHGGSCCLRWDPLSSWTLHEIKDLQGALCSRQR